ncbi:DUF539 domain-containing protein [Myxococcota bacterium]|nr:DUF539 domain-containing protein [Myxococcota bacterium]
MTATLIATAVFMGGAMALMALGVMLGRPALKGSCGGKNAECVCSAFDRLKCRTRKLAGAHEH